MIQLLMCKPSGELESGEVVEKGIVWGDIRNVIEQVVRRLYRTKNAEYLLYTN